MLTTGCWCTIPDNKQKQYQQEREREKDITRATSVTSDRVSHQLYNVTTTEHHKQMFMCVLCVGIDHTLHIMF